MAKKGKGPGQGVGGGPKTTQGKENSSQNARTHGVLSKKLILPGETQEQFDAVWNGWWTEYEPEGYAEERLVKLLIHNDWFLQRAMRALGEAEAALFGAKGLDAADWTEAQRSHLQVMQRYKNTAERAFYRSLAAVQGFRRDRLSMLKESIRDKEENRKLRDENERLKKYAPAGDVTKKNPDVCAEEKSQAQKLFQGRLHSKEQGKVPMLEVIEREKALGTGHVGPTGEGNLPRPMARGGCDCEMCSGNRAILEAAGVEW